MLITLDGALREKKKSKFIIGCLRVPWTHTSYIFCQIKPLGERKLVSQGNTERAYAALSRVCFPQEEEGNVQVLKQINL